MKFWRLKKQKKKNDATVTGNTICEKDTITYMTKQHPKVEFSLFENYSLSSSTLSSKIFPRDFEMLG